MTVHPEPTVTVMFTCKKCGLEKHKVEVRARRDSEVITYWMERVALVAVAKEHTLRSLMCDAKAVDLYLPMPDDPTKGVGMDNAGPVSPE